VKKKNRKIKNIHQRIQTGVLSKTRTKGVWSVFDTKEDSQTGIRKKEKGDSSRGVKCQGNW